MNALNNAIIKELAERVADLGAKAVGDLSHREWLFVQIGHRISNIMVSGVYLHINVDIELADLVCEAWVSADSHPDIAYYREEIPLANPACLDEATAWIKKAYVECVKDTIREVVLPTIEDIENTLSFLELP